MRERKEKRDKKEKRRKRGSSVAESDSDLFFECEIVDDDDTAPMGTLVRQADAAYAQTNNSNNANFSPSNNTNTQQTETSHTHPWSQQAVRQEYYNNNNTAPHVNSMSFHTPSTGNKKVIYVVKQPAHPSVVQPHSGATNRVGAPQPTVRYMVKPTTPQNGTPVRQTTTPRPVTPQAPVKTAARTNSTVYKAAPSRPVTPQAPVKTTARPVGTKFKSTMQHPVSPQTTVKPAVVKQTAAPYSAGSQTRVTKTSVAKPTIGRRSTVLVQNDAAPPRQDEARVRTNARTINNSNIQHAVGKTEFKSTIGKKTPPKTVSASKPAQNPWEVAKLNPKNTAHEPVNETTKTKQTSKTTKSEQAAPEKTTATKTTQKNVKANDNTAVASTSTRKTKSDNVSTTPKKSGATTDKTQTADTPVKKSTRTKSDANTAVETKTDNTKSKNKNSLEGNTMAKEKETVTSTETVLVEGAQGVPHGKFVIKRTDNNNFVFKLFSSNRRVVAVSAGFYSSLSACKSGIQSVINNAGIAPIEDQTLKNVVEQKCPKWIIFNDKRGEVRLRLIASNGNMVASTNDGYLSKDAAKKGIDAIARAAQGADIVRNDDLW